MKVLSERGAALVELALISPVLILLTFGAADFARGYYTGQQLTLAARTGAQVGATNVGSATSIGTTGDMASAAKLATNIAGMSANGENFCLCLNDVTATAGAEQACTLTCGLGTHEAMYVRVTTSATFAPVSHFPGIPNAFTVTRKATQRVVN